VDRFRFIRAFPQDVRYGVRRLASEWTFALAAVLILGLGIGANTAIFSFINAALFRPQVVTDPARIVEIYQNAADGSGPAINSYPAFRDMAEYTDIFASITAVSIPSGVTYRDQGALRSGVVEHTTTTYLSVIGLRPFLGRWFNASEDSVDAELVAVIGHQAWTKRFGADPSVIGRVIRINGLPVTIVGVGPAGYNGTINIGLVTDFWLPISTIVQVHGLPQRTLDDRRLRDGGFFVKARLRDGVTVAQAQAAMQILGARLAAEHSKEDPGKGITVLASTEVRVHPQMDAILAPFATLLLVVVGLVLAIACSNLATLLLVRGSARSRDVSIRLALGANRRQLICHLLTESLLLSIAGGALGCILAFWVISAFGALDLPIAMNVSLDYRVLAFTIGLSVITGIAVGLAPALKATKVDLLSTLRGDGQTVSSGRRWLTLRNALVVFQVSLSVLLLAGTTLFLQILADVRSLHSGFTVDGIAMLETDARYVGYSTAQAKNVYEELRQKIATIPGVQSAVLTRGEPMDTTGLPVVIEADRAETGPVKIAGAIWAGPGFFELLQIPILHGRVIDERDRADTQRVAMISETMARQYFGVVNAVGRRFRIESDANWIEVVGVVRDTGTSDPQGNLVDPSPQLFYRSFVQWSLLPTTILARTSLDASALAGAMQRDVRAVDADLPILSVKTMAQLLDESLAATRAATTFLGTLGTLGACLAGVGLYAIVSFAVMRRSREIGIRMALGAQSRGVVWTVAREVTILLAVGTGVGLVLSIVGILGLRMVGFSSNTLHFTLVVRPDPIALLWVAVFMAIVGTGAAYVPARRAAKMDPHVALRRD